MRSAVALCLAPLFLARPAAAQAPERPLLLPERSVADPVGASSFLSNPAFFLRGAGIEILHSDGPRDLPVAGEGIYLSMGPLLSLAGEYGRSPGDVDNVLFTFGSAIPLGDTLSVGVAYGHTAGAMLSDIHYDTWTAGALWRPWRFVSLGVAGYDLNGPRVRTPGGDVDLSPRLQAGVALRPIGDRLTLSTDYIRTDGIGDERWLFGLRGEVFPGFELYGASDDEGFFTAGITIRQTQANLRGHAVKPVGASRPGFVIGLDTVPHRQQTPIRTRPTYAVVTVDGPLPEAPVGRSLAPSNARKTYTRLLAELDRARRDPTIDGVAIRLKSSPGGLAKAREVRQHLRGIAAAGKSVVCHADILSTGLYVIATGCDAIVMSPGGTLFLTGLASSYHFLDTPLDKIGVDVEFVRRGKYKSVPETFAFDKPTKYFVEQIDALLDSEFDTLVATIAEGRKLDPAKVRELIERGGFLPAEAKEAGLIDEVAYRDEVEDYLKKKHGRKPEFVRHYYNVAHSDAPEWGRPPAIAVVYVGGTIVDGPSRTTPFGGAQLSGDETVRAALIAARKSFRVKAVVLRIDSPGGSSLASDLIWREVARLAKKKPVVVSMGDVAASGGYYIASPATEIMADEATVTGSIGVFMLRPNVAGLYEKIGVNHLVLKRGQNADLLTNEGAPLTAAQREVLEHLVEGFYQDFLQKVADGRKKKKEEVHEIAQGRVWSGADAKGVGLVDRYGGLWDAIHRAKELAHIRENAIVSLVQLPRAEFSFELGSPGDFPPLAIPAIGTIETWAVLGNRPAAYAPFRLRLE